MTRQWELPSRPQQQQERHGRQGLLQQKRSRVGAAGARAPADLGHPQQPVVEHPAIAAAAAAPASSPASKGGRELAQGIVKIEEALQLAGEMGAQGQAAEAQEEAAATVAGSSKQLWEQVDSDIEMLCS